MECRKKSFGYKSRPNADMKLLKKMAEKGFLVVAFEDNEYIFKKNEVQRVDFMWTYEASPYFYYTMPFQAEGWTCVIQHPGYQVFKAPEGTIPFFPNATVQINSLAPIKKYRTKLTLITFTVFIIAIMISILFPIGLWRWPLLILSLLAFEIAFIFFVAITIEEADLKER